MKLKQIKEGVPRCPNCKLFCLEITLIMVGIPEYNEFKKIFRCKNCYAEFVKE